MNRATENKIVLVTQKTRLENLIYRYNTESQVKFYIEHHGGDFEDYKAEDEHYVRARDKAISFLSAYGRTQVIDREFLPNYMFGEKDLVVALGRDGLVANVMKYLDEQSLIGVNPDPERWDGVLLPFKAEDLEKIVPETFDGLRKAKEIVFAKASLNDGQTLYGVNDIFIGQRTHVSARYEISVAGKKEAQSSSGIIVSTGLGSTGWLKSVVAGVKGVDSYFGVQSPFAPLNNYKWDSDYLFFTVREPYPSASTGADIVFGKIEKGKPLKIESCMPENGVIFSDGMEQDYLQFNSGAAAEITVAEKTGRLIV